MIAVVGMARSGLAVARLLRARGFSVWATDSNPAPALKPQFDVLGIPSHAGGHPGELLLEAEEIVLSPGVPGGISPLAEARKAGIPIRSELEVASRYLAGDIVAITGSNGKTTTTSLVGHILARGARPVQVGGNIGYAASAMVETSTPETINVLEVSSFQLEGTEAFRPHVAVLLNVTPDHMDRYKDFDAYLMTKFRLFLNQTRDDVAVLNRDDPNSFPPPVPLRARQRSYGLDTVGEGGDLADGMLRVDGIPVIEAAGVPLRGAHNLGNVLAALLVADVYGIDMGEVRDAVRSFRPVAHRLETVATIEGVEYVNDSKATNVESTIKAIEAFEAPIVLIAGGVAKGAQFDRLARSLAGRVRQVVTIGRAAAAIRQAIGQEVGSAVPVRHANDMAEAVSVSAELARAGDVVLLAPACASFDMYANYEERGDDFRSAVLSQTRVST